MNNYIEIITTCPDKATASRIGRMLVESGVVPCAQISAEIESVYRWKGKIETSPEYYCILKARESDFNRIAEMIQKEHPYEVPEIIGRPITAISQSYRNWLEE